MLLEAIVIFLMCFVLESVKLQVGFALGLFAVFGIIRYRTMTMHSGTMIQMTVEFIFIDVSIMQWRHAPFPRKRLVLCAKEPTTVIIG